MSAHLFVLEHDRGAAADVALGGLTAARTVASAAGAELHVAILGADGDELAAVAVDHGADTVHLVRHNLLTDYGPDAWAASVVQLADAIGAASISATGTDRGNEVMAHVAAMLDLSFVSNCLEVTPGANWEMTRVRWGGSLHERARLTSPRPLLTFAPHATEPVRVEAPAGATTADFSPSLDDSHAVTIVQDRVSASEGITLATAPVVVSGGRGVGSPEGFQPLEDLAAELGGVVGCSRVVTNNGWRNHRFQVGQTGTVVAPDVYIACGISGAIQHWVGMMNSKHILAINTDKDAPMVTKADWAIIADLHEVVPAITAELRKRRT